MRTHEESKSRQESFLIFKGCGQSFAIRTSHVVQILRTPRKLLEQGNRLSFHGTRIPVKDLGEVLCLPQEHPRRIVVARSDAGVFGMVVQSVEAVISFDGESLSDPPSFLKKGSHMEGILQTSEGPVVVMNLASVGAKVISSLPQAEAS